MRRILFLFLLLCCTIYACRKPDEVVDISPVPVFTVEGRLDGMPINMAAGEEGMYMYTFVREESDGTYSYGGRLAKENCDQDCGPALEIFLIDTIPFVDQNGEIRVWNTTQEILFHGSVLNDTVRCEMGLSNESYSPHGGLKESWQFNDGCIVHGKLNADYLYFPSAGAVKTKLMMMDSDSNFASIQKTINFYNEHDTGFYLDAHECTPGKANINVQDPEVNYPTSYKWNVPGQYGPYICVDLLDHNVEYTVTVTSGAEYETVLSCSVKKATLTGGLSYMKADYAFNVEGHQFSTNEAWPRVVIRYRDADGKWYDSRNIHQDDYCNYFALENVQPYQTNYQGINTKKAEAFFSATLKDSYNQLIKLEHFKVTFGFGSRE